MYTQCNYIYTCSTLFYWLCLCLCLSACLTVRLCLIIKFNDLIRKLAAIGFVHCCLCRTWFEFIVRFAFQSNAAHESTTSKCMQLSFPFPFPSPSLPSRTPLVTEAAPTDVARGCQSVLPIQLFSDNAVFCLRTLAHFTEQTIPQPLRLFIYSGRSELAVDLNEFYTIWTIIY